MNRLNKFRQSKANGSASAVLLSLFAFFLSCLVSCGQSSDSKNGDDKPLLRLVATAGNNQELTPKQTGSTALIFTTIDSADQSIPGVKLEVRLAEIPNELSTQVLGNTLPEAQIIKLWESALTPVNRDEFDVDALGYATIKEPISDSKGNVPVEITAPSGFNRQILILAKGSIEDQAGFEGYGYATMKTSSLGKNEQLILQTSSGNKETVGMAFYADITLLSGDKLVTTFNESVRVSISLKSENDLGVEIPTEEFSCQFLSGKCRVPGGPYEFTDKGRIAYLVESKKHGIKSETSIEAAYGIETDLVLSYSEINDDGKIDDICPVKLDDKPCISVSADQDTVVLYPIIMNQFGQPMYTAQAEWVITGPLEERASSLQTEDKQILSPLKAGSGTITLKTNSDLKRTFKYVIFPGEPSYFKVTSEHDNKESAVEPFKVTLRTFDRNDNFCFNYSGNFDIGATLTDAQPSPDGTEPVLSFNESIEIIEGEGKSTKTLHAVNSLDRPTIELNSKISQDRSAELIIDPGPIQHYHFTNEANGQGQIIAPDTEWVTLERYLVVAAGFDKYLNYVSDVNATFSGQSALSDGIAGTTAGTATIIPNQAGTGRILGAVVANGESFTSNNIIIRSNDPVMFSLSTTNNKNEISGESFDIIVEAHDAVGQRTSYSGTLALNFNSQSSNSWTGQSEVLPNGVINCQFNNGTCTLNNGGAGYSIAKSDLTTTILVEDTTGLIPDVWPLKIDTVKGSAFSFVITDKQGGPTNNAVPFVNNHLITISADDNLTLYTASVDKGGNYIGDETPEWTSASVLVSPYLSPLNTPAPSVTFSPVPVVSLSDNASISATAAGLQSGSIRIVVRHGVPSFLDIQSPGSIEAGTCADFTVSVRDSDNNIVTSYSTGLDYNIGIANGYTGTLENWSSGPEIHRFVSGFYKLDVSTGLWTPVKFDYHASFSVAPFDLGDYSSNPNAARWFGTKLGQVVSGQLTLPYKICLSDSSNITPVISAEFPAVSLADGTNYPAVSGSSQTISVNTGSAHFIGLFDQSGDPLCSFSSHVWDKSPDKFVEDINFTQGTDGTPKCLQRVVTDGPQINITAKQLDKGGNEIANASGSWTIAGPAAAIQSQTPSNIVLDGHLSATYQLSFTQPGLTNDTSTVTIKNTPGVPYYIDVVSSQPDAPQFFGMDFTAYDEYGNVASEFTGSLPYSIAVTQNIANLSSPIGTPATIPASSTLNFVQGLANSGSIFKLPLADTNVNFTFTFDDSGLTPNLNSNQASIILVPKTGTIISAAFQDGDDAGSNIIGNPFITTDNDNLVWSVAGKDSEGNILLIDSTISATGVLSNTLEVLKPYQVRIRPNLVGTGLLEATPLVPIAGITPPITTGTVTVTEGAVGGLKIEIQGVTNNIVTAGTTYNVSVKAIDDDGNDVTTFDGTKTLTWAVDNASENPEGRSINLPATGDYNFTNGICDTTFQITAYNASVAPTISVAHEDATLGIMAHSVPLTVNLGSFDHYATQSSSSYIPTADRQSVFSTTILARDEAGNNLPSSPALPITLSIVTDTGSATITGGDGSSMPISLTGTTTGINLVNGQATISDLSFDAPGNFAIIATDGSSSSDITTSSTITMLPSVQAVGSYKITLPNGNPIPQVVAGQSFNVQIDALDNYLRLVADDAGLEALTFSFSGASSSPSGQIFTFSDVSSFSGGKGSATLTAFTKETISSGNLTVQDNQSSAIPSLNPRVGSTTIDLQVVAAPRDRYELVFIHPDTANVTADSQTTGMFDIQILCKDSYGNIRAGENAVNLIAEYVSGSATNIGPIIGPSNSSAEVTGIALLSGDVTISSLHYDVAHTVRFRIDSPLGIPTNPMPQISFQPTIHTVRSYEVIPGATTIIASDNNLTLQVSAKDVAANTIDGIDGLLASQTYTWNGASASPGSAVSSIAPVAPVFSSPVFTSGTATVSHSLYNVAYHPISTLTIQDDYTTPRMGGNSAAINVTPGTVQVMEISGPSAKVAGEAFTYDVGVRDAYGNLSDNSCGNLDIAGANTSDGYFNGSATAPLIPASITQSSIGLYETGILRLYKAENTNLTFSACGYSQNHSIAISPKPINEIILSDQSTPPTSVAGTFAESYNGIGELACDFTNGTTLDVTCPQIYAYFWDMYGNQIPSQQCDWTYLNEFSAPVPPTMSGTPSEFMNISHTEYIDGRLQCDAGSKTVEAYIYGGLSRISASLVTPNGVDGSGNIIAAQYNVGADNITLWQLKQGVEVNVPNAGSEIVFIDSSASDPDIIIYDVNEWDAATNGLDSIAGPPSCIFDSNGLCPDTYFLSMQREEVDQTITVTVRGLTDILSDIDVTSGTAVNLAYDPLPVTPQVAGVSFDINAQALDEFGNTTQSGCDPMTSMVVGGGASPDGSTPTTPNAVGDGSGNYIVTITLVDKYTNTVQLNCASLTQDIPVEVTHNSTVGYTLTTIDSNAGDGYDAPR